MTRSALWLSHVAGIATYRSAFDKHYFMKNIAHIIEQELICETKAIVRHDTLVEIDNWDNRNKSVRY